MKKLIGVMLLMICGSAQAIPVTWTLENVLFDDATYLTGTFDYDTDTNFYSGINIQTHAGALSAFAYDDDNTIAQDRTPSSMFVLSLDEMGDLRILALTFTSNLTSAGGVVGLRVFTGDCQPSAPSCEVNSAGQRRVLSGSVSAVPVPAAFWLFGSGLGLLGWMRRKA